MTETHLPVIAVIPAYNAERSLSRLLGQLLAQKYDQIFVIDDASTDKTLKVAKSYGKRVKIIEGRVNAGAGGNRNRIIGHTTPAILHFIDADVEMVSKDTADIIKSLPWTKSTAYFGGLVCNPDGSQNPFNYGPGPSPATSIESIIQYLVWRIGLHARRIAGGLRFLAEPLLGSWPNIYKAPEASEVFWSAESNIVIKSDLFKAIGGYDPIFRYAEINDLGLRFIRAGYHAQFDPRIAVVHSSIDNILMRARDKRKARNQYIKKYGALNFFIPRLSGSGEKRVIDR